MKLGLLYHIQEGDLGNGGTERITHMWDFSYTARRLLTLGSVSALAKVIKLGDTCRARPAPRVGDHRLLWTDFVAPIQQSLLFHPHSKRGDTRQGAAVNFDRNQGSNSGLTAPVEGKATHTGT